MMCRRQTALPQAPAEFQVQNPVEQDVVGDGAKKADPGCQPLGVNFVAG
jgi:hypothetical protein